MVEKNNFDLTKFRHQVTNADNVLDACATDNPIQLFVNLLQDNDPIILEEIFELCRNKYNSKVDYLRKEFKYYE